MKIVYSLALEHGMKAYNCEMDLLESMSLSSMLSYLHSDSVELYCDDATVNAMNKSGLTFGFTKVHQVIPKDLIIYPDSEWALPKIYTYSLQEEPFIHIDIDVFLWGGLPLNLSQHRFVFQNTETFRGSYSFYNDVKKKAEQLNLLPATQIHNHGYAYNMGIFAVTQQSDIPLIKSYVSDSFKYVENFRKLTSIPKLLSGPENCCLFEQSFIINKLKEYGVADSEVLLILTEGLQLIEKTIKYSHFAVGNKRKPEIVEGIRERLSDYRSSYLNKKASKTLDWM